MSKLKFNPIDAFSFYAVLDGKRIGIVDYSPCTNHSWTFTNSKGDIQSFGSNKFLAVKNYLNLFMGADVSPLS